MSNAHGPHGSHEKPLSSRLECNLHGFCIGVRSSCGFCFLLALSLAFIVCPRFHENWQQDKRHCIGFSKLCLGVNKFWKELIPLLLETKVAVDVSTGQPLCTCQAQRVVQRPKRPRSSKGVASEKQTLACVSRITALKLLLWK